MYVEKTTYSNISHIFLYSFQCSNAAWYNIVAFVHNLELKFGDDWQSLIKASLKYCLVMRLVYVKKIFIVLLASQF